MGKRKELKYRGKSLIGDYLPEKVCHRLDIIQGVSEANGGFDDLKDLIFNLTDEEVEDLKEGYPVKNPARGELRDGQTLGVAYAYLAKRLVIGDSVGLGKTVTMAGLINRLSKENPGFRYLFLTEKALVPQTHDKLLRFTGKFADLLYADKLRVERYIRDRKDHPRPPSVVGAHGLINQNIFHDFLWGYKQKEGRPPFDLLIVDESAILSNTKTQTYKNAESIRDLFERVVILNATAFESKLNDYYSQINFVDPSLLPAVTNFRKEFVVMQYNPVLGYSTATEKYKNVDKFAELVKYRCFRRTRREMGAVMEDCSAELITVELTGRQKELLKKTQMPQMVYDCPMYFDDNMEGSEDNVPKFKAINQILQQKVKGGQVLVYVHYKDAQEALEYYLVNEGYDCRIMNGDTPQDERIELIEGFKRRNYQVLITNVQKGLDFGDCNHAIFYSSDPNPNRMAQFEGRMTRSFDIRDKHTYLICTEGAEEKRIRTTIANRVKASDGFQGNDFSMVLQLLTETRID